MAADDLIEQLAAVDDPQRQRRLLLDHPCLPDGTLPARLKALADRFLREDVQRSLQVAALLVYLETLTGDPAARALGLLAEANCCSVGGLGRYQRAVELYDEAAAIYRRHGRGMEEARCRVGQVYALAFLGRYAEALAAGEQAGPVLAAHGQRVPLAGLTMNLGMVHGRLGQDAEALAVLDRARDLYLGLGEEGLPFVAWVDQNRAVPLRNLGRFDDAIAASRSAEQTLAALGQTAEAARARQNLAVTYFVLGHYNESLRLLDGVRDVFWADGRHRDTLLVDLFVSDCLLQLRRFADALAKCARARTLFARLGSEFEVGQAVLNEAAAYTGLCRYDEALASLAEARSIFDREGNRVWAAGANLERAAVLDHKGEPAACLVAALACTAVFRAHHLPIKQAHACLVAARAALALGRPALARRLARRALAAGQAQDVPAITYQAHHLAATLARGEGDLPAALAGYECAIRELERLRGQLMVEYRVDFVADKQAVYQDMVTACLDAGDPARALDTAERCKSRAALDLVAYHLDIGIRARSEADRPLVDELVRLRARRDRLYRRWEGREESREEDWEAADRRRHETRQAMLAIEQRITELWHRLLVRNAGYARDASLWQVRAEPIQPCLDPGALLVQYFAAGRQLVAFCVARERLDAVRLGSLDDAARLVRLVWLNLGTAALTPPQEMGTLAGNVRGLLAKLYTSLVAPLEPVLAAATPERLIVVPHGPLHYLPFHALHDGARCLLERYEISYLPGGSFACYCRRDRRQAPDGALVLAHSHGGRLPAALDEARTVARLLGGQAYVEDEATVERVQAAAGGCRALHLAAHGEFRADNPLFSGIALAGGWLTTLDIFGLQLQASLVTLSACDTGRAAVGGGDELLGLMRAFLSAGAASLLLSQWTVEDQSSARLMTSFYEGLAAGRSKGAALRHAQLELLAGGAGPTAHPYFWAPFFLVGDTGPL